MIAWLLGLTAVFASLLGGVFFAFSSFVMPALSRIPAPEGIRAMQRVNVDVFHWSFMVPFFGTPALCLALPWLASESQAPWVWAGSGVFLAGCFMVTGLGNVPLNNALAAVDPSGREPARAEAVWGRYLREWVRWNHLRTLACILTATFFFRGLWLG